MAAVTDPFASYLKRADDLFEAGDIVQAGQIWQAILKKKPDHESARAGLYKVKLYFDARATQGGLVGLTPPVPAPAPVPVEAPKPPDTDITRLLEQGCTLYDAGHTEDAITKWVQVLAKEPDNVLAKGYISGARRVLEQSGPARPEPAPAPIVPATPAPKEPEPPAAPTEPAVDVERLLRDGCTLFDMGQMEDALRKWEEILAHDPGHALARAYVQDARKDLGLAPLEGGARPVPAPGRTEAPPAVDAEEGAGDERLEALIRDGVQLYDMGMVHEAQQKWQQVLDQAPGHRDAEAYLAMALRDQHAPAPSVPKPAPAASEMSGRGFPGLQARTSFATPAPQAPLELDLTPEPEEPPPAVQETPKAVTPPTALTSGQQKPRKGFNIQEALSGLSLPSWVASPVFILGTITGLVVLVVGTFYYMQHRKDKALRQAVESFRATAVAPVRRGSEVKNLAQTPEALRTAAQSAMGADPLMAYFNAQELARLAPADASVAELLGRAKAGLSGVEEKPATFADFEKQFKNGELEAAEHSAAYLLSQTPDDRILRERTARLYLALAQAYAGKEAWSDAEDRLRRGQALFPSDRSWSAKLALLSRIQSMAKSERAPWIQLLG